MQPVFSYLGPSASRFDMDGRWETWDHPADGAPLVHVPAGPFLMGLPDHDFLADEHEKPQRTVHLAGFWIEVYPVTNERFARFLAAGGYDDASFWSVDGWAWRSRERVACPLQWDEPG